MNMRWLPSVATVLVVAAAAWLLWPNARPMPEVTFNLLDGRKIFSSELRGKSVLVNFWSVSCETCLNDIPQLTRLQDDMRDQGLVVIGVAVPHDPPPAVISAVEQLKPGFPIALDVHGEVSAAFGGIKVTPTNFLVDPDGNISFSERGPIYEPRIRATLLTFLK